MNRLIYPSAWITALMLAVSYLALPWFGKASDRHYLAVGVVSVALTLTLEVALGRFISWLQLLDAYAFKDGNVWPLVLLLTLLASLLAGKLRGWV